MFDTIIGEPDSKQIGIKLSVNNRRLFWTAKRIFDVVVSLALLPLLVVIAAALFLLNPFSNRGALFFIQTRMGMDCKPFKTIKFRTMTAIVSIERGPDDPVERHRITRLGRLLRKSRIDELPQILNVLMGQMSLIGPRPDYYLHAISYANSIPGYQERHIVRPGISGLAQVHVGYVEGTDATRAKVKADHAYISNAGFILETKLVVMTIATIFTGAGS